MFTELYAFITGPTEYVSRKQESPPKALMFFSLFLVCMSFSAGESSPILMSLFWFVVASFVLVVYTSVLDFVAQLFGLKAQSKTLYYYLGLAYLPYCLMVPLNLIMHVNPFLYVLGMIPVGMSFYLELTVIKTLYVTTYWRSFFIWVIPSLTTVVLIGLVSLLGVGMLF